MIKTLFTSLRFYYSLLGLAILGGIVLVLMDTMIMPAYTNYNEGVTVPDITKMSLEDARQKLDSYGLRYQVVDRRSHSAYPADFVIDQSPTASQIVKPYRKIYLTVNTTSQPKVVVPDVTNLSFRNAKIQLQNYGLNVGTVSYVSSRFKNSVMRQSIEPNTRVDKGTLVDLTVSDGLGVNKVEVPDIVGLRLTEAQQKLRSVGLRVGQLRFQPSKEFVPNTILGYTPSDADSIIEGTSLDLVVSERFEVKEESESGAMIIDSTDQAPSDTTNDN